MTARLAMTLECDECGAKEATTGRDVVPIHTLATIGAALVVDLPPGWTELWSGYHYCPARPCRSIAVGKHVAAFGTSKPLRTGS